jgi:hypothetical protein
MEALRFPCALDKSPLTRRGFYNAKRGWYDSRWPLVGLPTGHDFICIDFDPGALEHARLLPQDTFVQQTRRGLHHFYLPEAGWPSAVLLMPRRMIELKAANAYVIDWSREGLPNNGLPLRRIGMGLAELKAVFAPFWEGPVVEDRLGGETKKRQRAVSNCQHLSNSPAPDVDLSRINPIEYREFGRWLRLLTSCKVAGVSREAFVEWSAGDPQYAEDAKRVLEVWDRVKPDGRVSEATLFGALRDGGTNGQPADVSAGAPPPVPKGRRRMTWAEVNELNRMTRWLAGQKEDEGALFWLACRFGEWRMEFVTTDRVLEELIVGAAWQAGLRNKDRVRRQVRNGMRIGALEWLDRHANGHADGDGPTTDQTSAGRISECNGQHGELTKE